MRTGFSRTNPKLLDFITWSVLNGVRLFQRVQVTPQGLMAIDRIPEFDFAVIVPTKTTFSVLNILEEPNFPLKVSPTNVGDVVPWWPDLSWGSFCMISYMTRALATENPKSLQVYLDSLPFDPAMPIGKLADVAQHTSEYREAIKPVLSSSRVNSEEEFHAAFRHAYCLFRRHAVPFWSGGSAGIGHPYFAASKLVERSPNCDIMGMVPVIDLAVHSSKPNSAVGYPDKEMMLWLGQEKGVPIQKDSAYFVLQAQRDIESGEMITVDKNTTFNFDPETFQAWFGFPWEHEVNQHGAVGDRAEATGAAPPSVTSSFSE